MYHFSILDLFPYFVLVVSLLYFYKKQNEKMMALVLFIFMAIRVGVGYDYYQYKFFILDYMSDYSWNAIEPLSKVLMLAARYTHFQVFFILSSAIVVFLLYKTCTKLSVNPRLSLLIYVLFPLFFFEHLSIVRNSIAFLIVFWGYIWLKEKKYVYFVASIIVAYLFHGSALIAVLAVIPYLCRSYNMHIWGYILSFIVGQYLISYVLSVGEFLPGLDRFSKYALNTELKGGDKMVYLVNMLGVINLILWKRVKNEDASNTFYLSMLNFGLILYNVFSYETTLAFRFSVYFLMLTLIIVPIYMRVLSGESTKLLIIGYFVFSFIASLGINILSNIKTAEKMNLFPYQTIFYYEDVYDGVIRR